MTTKPKTKKTKPNNGFDIYFDEEEEKNFSSLWFSLGRKRNGLLNILFDVWFMWEIGRGRECENEQREKRGLGSQMTPFRLWLFSFIFVYLVFFLSSMFVSLTFILLLLLKILPSGYFRPTWKCLHSGNCQFLFWCYCWAFFICQVFHFLNIFFSLGFFFFFTFLLFSDSIFCFFAILDHCPVLVFVFWNRRKVFKGF